mmetsp:Transcript_22005/g.86482  ORF Transcript_22005/g.86482 Transcript_22005/m.86482 type:complete len:250 (-) Transcript_22005:48-797(-)
MHQRRCMPVGHGQQRHQAQPGEQAPQQARVGRGQRNGLGIGVVGDELLQRQRAAAVHPVGQQADQQHGQRVAEAQRELAAPPLGRELQRRDEDAGGRRFLLQHQVGGQHEAQRQQRQRGQGQQQADAGQQHRDEAHEQEQAEQAGQRQRRALEDLEAMADPEPAVAGRHLLQVELHIHASASSGVACQGVAIRSRSTRSKWRGSCGLSRLASRGRCRSNRRDTQKRRAAARSRAGSSRCSAPDSGRTLS